MPYATAEAFDHCMYMYHPVIALKCLLCFLITVRFCSFPSNILLVNIDHNNTPAINNVYSDLHASTINLIGNKIETKS